MKDVWFVEHGHQRLRRLSMPGAMYGVGILPTVMEIMHLRKSNNSDFPVRRFLAGSENVDWDMFLRENRGGLSDKGVRLGLTAGVVVEDPGRSHHPKMGQTFGRNWTSAQRVLFGVPLDLHQIMPDGEPGYICVIAEIQLPENPETVGVHGLDTDVVGLCYFAIRLPHGETTQNLNFPLG